jgi:hypothetical protein
MEWITKVEIDELWSWNRLRKIIIRVEKKILKKKKC